ncbi:hypothetical protein Y032_0408g928 [Ancylostoma ceylanicum]|uniref:Uncharacterized protein n=1 Tax=Ancylostoma ceylanicum TaxID=53326 RepID=A0A016X3J9_9BILA|nr:hypothetical protein Y032_0408g928 [Ancylostoma ceylanicum]
MPTPQRRGNRNDMIVYIIPVNHGNGGGPDEFRITPRMESILMEIAARMQTMGAKLSHLTETSNNNSLQLSRLEKKVNEEESRQMEGRYGEGVPPMGNQERARSGRRGNSPEQGRSGMRSPICIFRNGDYWATQCRGFESLEARCMRLREIGKCERCLRNNDHLVTSCNARSTCFYCARAGR